MSNHCLFLLSFEESEDVHEVETCSHREETKTKLRYRIDLLNLTQQTVDSKVQETTRGESQTFSQVDLAKNRAHGCTD